MNWKRRIALPLAFLATGAQMLPPTVLAGDKEILFAGVDRIDRQMSDIKILINRLEYRLGEQTAKLDKAEDRLKTLSQEFQEISDNELKQAEDLAKIVERLAQLGVRVEIIDDQLVIVGCILSDASSRLDEASGLLAQANAILAELPGQIRRAKLRMFIIGFVVGMGVGMAIGGAAGGATSTVTSGGGSVNAWTGATTATTVTTTAAAGFSAWGLLGLAAIPFAMGGGGRQQTCTTAGCTTGVPCRTCMDATTAVWCKTPECQAAMERLRLYREQGLLGPEPKGCKDCEPQRKGPTQLYDPLRPIPDEAPPTRVDERTPTPMPEPEDLPPAPTPSDPFAKVTKFFGGKSQ